MLDRLIKTEHFLSMNCQRLMKYQWCNELLFVKDRHKHLIEKTVFFRNKTQLLFNFKHKV